MVRKRKREQLIDKLMLLGVALLAMAFMFGTMSCRTTKETKETRSDSVRVEIKRERYDSIVYRDSISFEMQIATPCDSLGRLKPVNIKQRNGRSYATAKSKGDTLIIDCGCEESINQLTRENSHLKQEVKQAYSKAEELVKKAAGSNLWLWLMISIALNALLVIIIIRIIR